MCHECANSLGVAQVRLVGQRAEDRADVLRGERRSRGPTGCSRLSVSSSTLMNEQPSKSSRVEPLVEEVEDREQPLLGVAPRRRASASTQSLRPALARARSQERDHERRPWTGSGGRASPSRRRRARSPRRSRPHESLLGVQLRTHWRGSGRALRPATGVCALASFSPSSRLPRQVRFLGCATARSAWSAAAAGDGTSSATSRARLQRDRRRARRQRAGRAQRARTPSSAASPSCPTSTASSSRRRPRRTRRWSRRRSSSACRSSSRSR